MNPDAVLSWLFIVDLYFLAILFIFSFRWAVCFSIACFVAFLSYLLIELYFANITGPTLEYKFLITFAVFQMFTAAGLVTSYVFLPIKWTKKVPQKYSSIIGFVILILTIILSFFLLK